MTTGGTGLGLYIARSLATAMGGELACSSTLNVGSVFTFTLRLASSDVEPMKPEQPAPLPDAPAGVGVPRPRRAPPWVAAPPRPKPADGLIAP